MNDYVLDVLYEILQYEHGQHESQAELRIKVIEESIEKAKANQARAKGAKGKHR